MLILCQIDSFAAITQRAPDFIHVDECILTYGYSKVVEIFLKAAGAKRRFQVSVYTLEYEGVCRDFIITS